MCKKKNKSTTLVLLQVRPESFNEDTANKSHILTTFLTFYKWVSSQDFSAYFDIFSYSGPSGILGSDRKQNTT